MTNSTSIAHPLLAAMRAAEHACLTATTDHERRVAERALMAAGLALSQRVHRLYDGDTMTGWLIDAADWLDAHLDHAEWFEREERWMAKLMEYQELFGALIDARAILARDGVVEDALTEEPMEQGALL